MSSGCSSSPHRRDSPGRTMSKAGELTAVKQILLPPRSALPYIHNLANERLQSTRTLIPPLPRNYHVHRSGNLQPLSLPKDLSHSQVRPLSLGSCEGYGLSTNPSFLLPSALVLNKRNTFSVDNCHLNRPKVNHRTYNLLTIKDIQKGQGSYPNPMAGAPHSFLHRVSELSSMEGETARQEKLGKNSKNRRQES